MPIDLKKLAQDVVHSDSELQVLALQTLLRMEQDLVEASADVLVGLRGDLTRLAASGIGDSRFFARQCLDHIDRVRAAAEREARIATGTPAAGPPPVAAPRLTQRLQAAVPVALDLAALARIAAEKRKEARPHILAMLAGGGPDSELAASAIAALAAIGEPSDVAAAAPYLKHRDARVRANTVELVEALAPRPQQVALLAGLVGDPENRVRANVLKALGALGQEAVFTSLAAMLSSSAIGTRASAVYALRHIRGDRGIELLWKASRDPSELIRLRVVDAARCHRHPQAVEILRKLGNDIDISIAEAAYSALAALAVAESTGQSTGDRAGPLAGLGSADAQVQVRALKEIESGGRKEAREAVVQLVGVATDPLVLAQAIAALARIGQPDDATLVALFLAHTNDRVRANAVEATARLAPRAVAVQSLTPMVDDPDNRVRGNAIKELAEAGVMGLESHVEPMLLHPEVPMRLSGAWCAAYVEPAAALRLLARASVDGEADVRRKVVESLGKLPPGPEVAQLARDLATDPVIAIAHAARELMDKIGGSLPLTPLRKRITQPLKFSPADAFPEPTSGPSPTAYSMPAPRPAQVPPASSTTSPGRALSAEPAEPARFAEPAPSAGSVLSAGPALSSKQPRSGWAPFARGRPSMSVSNTGDPA